jgi:type I restriction enzyme S subunit
MNRELLLAHFNRICQAPNAVPHLRRFVLDLAVRGKLLQQQPQAERVGDRYLNEPGSDLLPRNWRLLNFGKFCDIQGGNQPPKSLFVDSPRPGYVRLFQIRDLGESPIPTYIPVTSTNRFCREGEILIGRYGASVGKVFWAKDGAYNVALAKFIFPESAFLRQFAFLVLKSSFFQEALIGATRSAQAGFNKGDLARINFPLPPLVEQARIITKMDELTALCDQLDAAHADVEVRRDRLLLAAVQQLNDGVGAQIRRPQAQFYLGNLSRLISRPDQVRTLRQTILTFAVRGQLVQQDPGDEPVAKLLCRIQSQNTDRIRAGKSSEPNPSKDGIPFDIPHTWQWEPLQSIIVFGPQNGISPRPSSRPDAPRAITLTATTKGIFDSRFFKRVDASVPFDSEFWLRYGDLLFQRGNTREYVGMAAYYTGKPHEFLYPDLMMKVRVSEEVDLRYVHLCAVAPHARSYFSSHATGAQSTMPKINQGILLKLPIPIAPLAEQRRIVAKVDELMTLCDRLETQVTNAEHETSRLLESVLHYALTTPEAFSDIANPARQGEAHA